MRRSLLILLALLPATYASTTTVGLTGVADAAPARASVPRGAAVYRPACLGDVSVDESRVGGSPGPGVTSSKPSPQPGQALTNEVLDRVPPGRSFESAVEVVESEESAQPSTSSLDSTSRGNKGRGGGGKKGKLGARSAPQAAEASVAEPPPPPPSPLAEPVVAATPTPHSAAVDLGDDAYRERESNRISAEVERTEGTRQEMDRDEAPRSVLDWGAEIFLSNDDSMSLASAQRVLYNVMNGRSLSAREIRPHELLNYFSFDTVTPDADQLFDVLASAERHGDSLSVALAVRGGSPTRQPLDLTVLVDRSCSMQDEGRMDYTQRAMTQMSDQLEDGDRVDVVLFDDTVCVPLENWVAGRDDPELLRNTIASMQPEGATDLDLGLREAYRVSQSHLDTHGRNRRVMVMTDAMLNTGDVNPNTVSEIGRAFDDDGVRLTGVGVGRDFNDKVLHQLTEKGKGAYVYLGSEAVVDRLFGPDGFPSLTETIAHDVQFSLQLPDSLAMQRFYGEEASTRAEDVQPINYYAGTSQLFLQDLVIADGDPVRSDAVTLTIRYRDARTGEPETRTFKTTVGVMLDADRHNVRKGLALMAWSDLLVAQSMGADPCGAPLDTYAQRAGQLTDDAEVVFINGLVERTCGAFDLPTVIADVESVPFKVRVDSDIPIAEVGLACGRHRWSEALTGSDTVARFQAVPGACQVTLAGRIPMTAQVDVPVTGGDLRCIVRGGRLDCS